MRRSAVRDKGSISWLVQRYLVVDMVYERVSRHQKCFFQNYIRRGSSYSDE